MARFGQLGARFCTPGARAGARYRIESPIGGRLRASRAGPKPLSPATVARHVPPTPLSYSDPCRRAVRNQGCEACVQRAEAHHVACHVTGVAAGGFPLYRSCAQREPVTMEDLLRETGRRPSRRSALLIAHRSPTAAQTGAGPRPRPPAPAFRPAGPAVGRERGRGPGKTPLLRTGTHRTRTCRTRTRRTRTCRPGNHRFGSRRPDACRSGPRRSRSRRSRSRRSGGRRGAVRRAEGSPVTRGVHLMRHGCPMPCRNSRNSRNSRNGRKDRQGCRGTRRRTPGTPGTAAPAVLSPRHRWVSARIRRERTRRHRPWGAAPDARRTAAPRWRRGCARSPRIPGFPRRLVRPVSRNRRTSCRRSTTTP